MARNPYLNVPETHVNPNVVMASPEWMIGDLAPDLYRFIAEVASQPYSEPTGSGTPGTDPEIEYTDQHGDNGSEYHDNRIGALTPIKKQQAQSETINLRSARKLKTSGALLDFAFAQWTEGDAQYVVRVTRHADGSYKPSVFEGLAGDGKDDMKEVKSPAQMLERMRAAKLATRAVLRHARGRRSALVS